MAVAYDFAKKFYDNILCSNHGTDAIWIDENGVESDIKIIIRRTPFQGTSKNFNRSLYNTRRIYVTIANSAVYGRTDIKVNKEKIKFKEDVTNTNDKIFNVSNIVKSDKSKIVLSVA